MLFIGKIYKFIYYFLFLVGLWYWIRLINMSLFFQETIKMGPMCEMLIRYIFYFILFITTLINYLNKKSSFRLFLFIFNIIFIVTLLYGRYSGSFLSFEEYVGTSKYFSGNQNSACKDIFSIFFTIK